MDKPWTESRGPIVANEFDLKKAEAVSKLLSSPIGILPSLLDDPIKPFAIGLWSDIRDRLKPEESTTTLRRATGAYLHSKRYYFATAQPDSMRHDINGDPIEPVSISDRIKAQNRFLSLRQSSDNETPDATPAPAPAQPVLTKAGMIRASLLRKTKK